MSAETEWTPVAGGQCLEEAHAVLEAGVVVRHACPALVDESAVQMDLHGVRDYDTEGTFATGASPLLQSVARRATVSGGSSLGDAGFVELLP